MSKYENAMKLMDERCGNGKDNLIALATISLDPGAGGKPRPAARMVDAYYEDGAFYVVTYALSNKMKQIGDNPDVAVCAIDWFSGHGAGENLGWVRDEKNAAMMVKLREAFAGWYSNGHVNEEDKNTCLLRICLTDGIIIDNEKKYGEWQYVVDFTNKTV